MGRESSYGPGRPRNSDREFRDEAILDAAAAVFVQHGYRLASTAEIARKAGASKHTLYSRYPSKAALFAAVMLRRTLRIVGPIADLDTSQPPHEALQGYGMNALRVVLGDETCRLNQIIVAEGHDFPELASAYWENGPGRGRQTLVRYLAAMADRRALSIDDPEESAEFFIGALYGMAVIRVNLGLPSPLADEEARSHRVRGVVRAFLRLHGPRG